MDKQNWTGLTVILAAVATAGVLAFGCSDDESSPSSSGAVATTPTARAKLEPTGTAAGLSGTVDFTDNGDETTVTVTVSGATPGDHGLHIHQNGSCAAVDGGGGLAAGGHWNPADAGHGYPTAATHHIGDLGNLTVGADGKGTLTMKSKEFYAHDGPSSVVGHAVIFHEKADDGSQPVGNAGARPGCGVIARL